MSRETCLYMATVPSGLCKIGIATNPEQRVVQLQTGNHERISLARAFVIAWPDCSAAQLEAKMHELLAEFRVTGEWFAVPLDYADYVMKLAVFHIRRPDVIRRWKLWGRSKAYVPADEYPPCQTFGLPRKTGRYRFDHASFLRDRLPKWRHGANPCQDPPRG